MTFVDKTQDLIETFINNIRRNINGLKDVVRRLNSPNNYDYETDSLRLNEGAPQIIKSYISDYYKFIGMIKDIEQEDLNEMIKTKESSFNSSNYKTNYGLKFIDEYQKLYNLMHRRFGVFPRELRQAKSAPSHSYPPNIIEISKTFEDLVKFNDVEFLLNLNVNITSNFIDQEFPKIASTIEVNLLENEDNFTDDEWNNLYKLSEETFVEESDSLKEGAAGAGLTDND